MSKLVWDAIGEHIYETGVRNGVLYTSKTTTANDVTTTDPYGTATAWNGLTAVTESPSGAEATALWADDIKYLSLISAEEFGGTIEAYTYPDEFAACDGSASISTGIKIGQQPRATFGLCYRTVLGNDTLGEAYGYKLHIIYGCKAAPSEKAYATINDSPEAITFSWELSTVPVPVSGAKPTATLELDSVKLGADKMKAIEDVLYGRDADAEHNVTALEGRLPLPNEIKQIIDAVS